MATGLRKADLLSIRLDLRRNCGPTPGVEISFVLAMLTLAGGVASDYPSGRLQQLQVEARRS